MRLIDIKKRIQASLQQNFLLNLFSDASAAYSLRRLFKWKIKLPSEIRTPLYAISLRYVVVGYTGAVIRVRRSNDNTELDFNPTQITNGTLLTWVGAGSGFVTTIYDQTGNGHHMTQTNASRQGIIISSGVMNMLGGKPVILRSVDNNGGYISTFAPNDGVTVKGLFYVGDNKNNSSMMFGSTSGNTDYGFFAHPNSTSTVVDIRPIISLTKLNGLEVITTTRGQLFTDTNLHFLSYREINFDFSDNTLGLGYRDNNPSNFGMMSFQELIISETDGAGDDINFNINAYYRIYDQWDGISVVRVRRSSNNAELDFKEKEIIDGTLLNWVNAPIVHFQSNFIPASNQFTGNQLTPTIGQSIGGQNNALKLELIGGAITHWTGTGLGFEIGKDYTVTFDVYIPSSNALVNEIQLNRPIQITRCQPALDAWQTFSFSGISLHSAIRFFPLANGANNINADGDVFYLKNITLTQTTADGLVTKWYDQSGNGNDGIQTTASRQPKIVDVGVLVTENGKPAIRYDGVNDDFLTSLAFVHNAYSFLVSKMETTSFPILLGSSAFQNRFFIFNSGSRMFYQFYSSTVTINSQSVTSFFDIQYLHYIEKDHTSNLNLFFQNNNIISAGIRNIAPTGGLGNVQIASELNSAFPFKGTMQEIIIFGTRQNLTRPAIQLNINNYYSIY